MLNVLENVVPICSTTAQLRREGKSCTEAEVSVLEGVQDTKLQALEVLESRENVGHDLGDLPADRLLARERERGEVDKGGKDQS